MAHFAALVGLGSYLPPRRVTNEELATTFDTSDEWITTRTGIRSRHWALPGVATSDLAGAVVLSAVPDADRPGVLLGVDLGSDGSQQDLIMIPGGGSRERATPGEPDPQDRYFTMQGKKVFVEAVTRMGDSASALLDRIGWPADSFAHLV